MIKTAITWSPEKLLAIDYTPEQQAAIAAALAEIEADTSGFCYYSRSDRIIQRNAQTFAVFGDVAHTLLDYAVDEDDGDRFEYLPVIIDGQMIHESPEEGCSGLLYLSRWTRRRGQPFDGSWSGWYRSNGWLYTHELEQSNAEVAERIMDEISFGDTYLFRDPAAWA